MKKNLYNSNDEDHQHVIKLLNELPKEKAPPNFEYNLRVKIENKNFALNTENKYSSSVWWKILAPVAATTVAAIFVFTSVLNDPENFENPFQISPQPRSELKGNINAVVDNQNTLNESNRITENDVVLNNPNVGFNKESRSVKVEENRVKSSKTIANRPDFPFNEQSTTNLDELLNQNKNKSVIRRNAALAGRSDSKSFFNGFYIREEVDKEYVDQLKARMDSLKMTLKNKKRNMQNME